VQCDCRSESRYHPNLVALSFALSLRRQWILQAGMHGDAILVVSPGALSGIYATRAVEQGASDEELARLLTLPQGSGDRRLRILPKACHANFAGADLPKSFDLVVC